MLRDVSVEEVVEFALACERQLLGLSRSGQGLAICRLPGGRPDIARAELDF